MMVRGGEDGEYHRGSVTGEVMVRRVWGRARARAMGATTAWGGGDRGALYLQRALALVEATSEDDVPLEALGTGGRGDGVRVRAVRGEGARGEG
jgi:hypothetical protein